MTSEASILKLVALPRESNGIVDIFRVVGMAMELAAGAAVERETAQVERVGRPLREGPQRAVENREKCRRQRVW